MDDLEKSTRKREERRRNDIDITLLVEKMYSSLIFILSQFFANNCPKKKTCPKYFIPFHAILLSQNYFKKEHNSSSFPLKFFFHLLSALTFSCGLDLFLFSFFCEFFSSHTHTKSLFTLYSNQCKWWYYSSCSGSFTHTRTCITASMRISFI